MIITNKAHMDFMNQSKTIIMNAVQNDRFSRNLELSLQADGEAWEIPEDVTVLIRYRKPDGKAGEYDSLPDGTQAWSAAGNVLTIALAPQVLTAAGLVRMTVTLVWKEKQISTFAVLVHVYPVVSTAETESEDYYCAASFLRAPLKAEVGQYLRVSSVDEKSGVIGVEAVPLPLDTIAVTNVASGEEIFVTDVASLEPRNLKVFGKTTQAGRPTVAAPIELISAGGAGTVEVNVLGKNLFAPALLSQTDGYNTYDESTGLWTTSSIGSWGRSLLVNVAGSSSQRDINTIIKVPQNTTITITFFDLVNNTNSTNCFSVRFFDQTGKPLASEYPSANNVLTLKTLDQPCYMDFIRSNNSGTLSFSKIQVEIGETATDFEPYTKQTLVVSTPNALPGIAVSSGGNYTDQNGQQWICDEVDFAKGVHIQRIGVVESYAGESITKAYLSTTGALSAGAKVLYPLETPVETALDAETLAGYAELYLHCPNAAVFSDAGAGLSLAYLADTKSYIDNKFAALHAAIANHM